MCLAQGVSWGAKPPQPGVEPGSAQTGRRCSLRAGIGWRRSAGRGAHPPRGGIAPAICSEASAFVLLLSRPVLLEACEVYAIRMWSQSGVAGLVSCTAGKLRPPPYVGLMRGDTLMGREEAQRGREAAHTAKPPRSLLGGSTVCAGRFAQCQTRRGRHDRCAPRSFVAGRPVPAGPHTSQRAAFARCVLRGCLPIGRWQLPRPDFHRLAVDGFRTHQRLVSLPSSSRTLSHLTVQTTNCFSDWLSKVVWS